MTAKRQALNLCAWSLAVLALVAFLPGESEAYIEAPFSSGRHRKFLWSQYHRHGYSELHE